MFDPDTRALLEGGAALIVATVGPDGLPHAGRGWGLVVLDDDPDRLRLLVSGDDHALCRQLGDGGAVAVTAADVPTLRSVQLKGRSLGIEPAGPADFTTAEAYIDALFADIETADGAARPILERWRPRAIVACTVAVEDRFDQTPGPDAGSPLSPVRS
ncbi:pyridoxamine 5'-phosphate oxidase family protein [Rhabdothermincola salaria]|uniref:pyridoxamine 5'-phosphate oxidase family protein n=1 Tax=Rhabdothermincola salaria TaxID=2903142 RepID=UPI001E304054|nr:pyridoxamine 5'-phosphate oxidase family protein [Rhabdothermincola salaria]MCD9625702.1 pyridoxamine 5'-phosphate oxidase family protein [Rhabdothermincola salaria]